MVRSGGAGAGDDERLCLADGAEEPGTLRKGRSEDDDGPEGKAMEATLGCLAAGTVQAVNAAGDVDRFVVEA